MLVVKVLARPTSVFAPFYKMPRCKAVDLFYEREGKRVSTRGTHGCLQYFNESFKDLIVNEIKCTKILYRYYIKFNGKRNIIKRRVEN